MKTDNILVLVAGVLFFVVVAYIIYQYALPAPEEHAKKLEEFYLKTLGVGKNATNYMYSYKENLDGYIMKTTLLKKGERQAVIIETPLSKREIYYLENDTVMCVSFAGKEKCSSIKNDSTMAKYATWAKAQFFSEEKSKKEVENNEILIKKKALNFKEIEKRELNGKECENIIFTIDYTNLTLEDLVKFGITQNSPTKIDGEVCYNAKANEIYGKTFKYKYLGKERITDFRHLDSDWNYQKEIEIGRNLSEGAVDLFFAAKEKQDDFLTCLEKEGAEKDRCIFSMAISEGYGQLCDYAGTKADGCKLNFAAMTDNLKKCEEIANATIKDNCYISIAGRRKNPEICDMLSDKNKTQTCKDFAMRNETINIPPLGSHEENKTSEEGNETEANMSDAERWFIEYLLNQSAED